MTFFMDPGTPRYDWLVSSIERKGAEDLDTEHRTILRQRTNIGDTPRRVSIFATVKSSRVGPFPSKTTNPEGGLTDNI